MPVSEADRGQQPDPAAGVEELALDGSIEIVPLQRRDLFKKDIWKSGLPALFHYRIGDGTLYNLAPDVASMSVLAD